MLIDDGDVLEQFEHKRDISKQLEAIQPREENGDIAEAMRC